MCRKSVYTIYLVCNKFKCFVKAKYSIQTKKEKYFSK